MRASPQLRTDRRLVSIDVLRRSTVRACAHRPWCCFLSVRLETVVADRFVHPKHTVGGVVVIFSFSSR
jgi:hypothetical protein